MRFVIFVIDQASNSAAGDEMARIDAFNAKLESAGQLVLAAGFAGPDLSTLIDNRDGTASVAAGSLNSTNFYSGFWLIEAMNANSAQEIALEASRACNRRVELRPLL
jgi:hypothetical protein